MQSKWEPDDCGYSQYETCSPVGFHQVSVVVYKPTDRDEIVWYVFCGGATLDKGIATTMEDAKEFALLALANRLGQALHSLPQAKFPRREFTYVDGDKLTHVISGPVAPHDTQRELEPVPEPLQERYNGRPLPPELPGNLTPHRPVYYKRVEFNDD